MSYIAIEIVYIRKKRNEIGAMVHYIKQSAILKKDMTRCGRCVCELERVS